MGLDRIGKKIDEMLCNSTNGNKKSWWWDLNEIDEALCKNANLSKDSSLWKIRREMHYCIYH